MLVFWVDSEMDKLAKIFYLSLCDTIFCCIRCNQLFRHCRWRMVASLSNGKCQKASRKAVARVLLNSASLRGQFHEADVLVKILGLKCGISIDQKTLLKAFTCSDDAYFVALRDMGVEHDG